MTTAGGRKPSGKTIVVGVDGSANAHAALGFAIDEAAMRSSSLRVVAAVQLPDYGLGSVAMLALPRPEELVDDIRNATQSRVDELVAACPSL